MQVRDFMIHKVYTVKPSATVKEVISLFESERIGGVPVVDDQGSLLGIVSDGDIVRFLSPAKGKIHLAYYFVYIEEDEKIEDILLEKMNTPIEEVMVKKNVKTLKPDDDFEDAMRILSKHRFKKVPVVNPAGRVIGVISRGDIIQSLAKNVR